MPVSKNLMTYGDVRRVLDAAARMGGGRYVLPTAGHAVRWRQRCYMFRKLYFEHFAQQVAGTQLSIPITPYDGLCLRIKPEEPEVVLISFEGPLEGTLTSPTGDPEPVDLSFEMDELELEALGLFAEKTRADD